MEEMICYDSWKRNLTPLETKQLLTFVSEKFQGAEVNIFEIEAWASRKIPTSLFKSIRKEQIAFNRYLSPQRTEIWQLKEKLRQAKLRREKKKTAEVKKGACDKESAEEIKYLRNLEEQIRALNLPLQIQIENFNQSLEDQIAKVPTETQPKFVCRCSVTDKDLFGVALVSEIGRGPEIDFIEWSKGELISYVKERRAIAKKNETAYRLQ